MMRVLIDADACPVVRIAEEIAKKHGVGVTLLCDTSHILRSDYSEIRVIGEGADAVDFALVNLCRKGDIVVTQDYGVAAMALGKGAYAIHQSGMLYTGDNIDGLLMERQRWQEAARSVADHWPQIKGDLPALLARMKAISESYGDPTLWQRAPAGIMREAAVELYGMPSRPDDGALYQAVRAAHEQGRKAAADRRRALAGLAPPQISRSAPPPLTEEEKILQDMRRARKGRLF